MLALHLSGRHVIDDGGRTARQRLARRALCIDARALHRAPGKGALALRSGFQLMVADQRHAIAATVEATHSLGRRWTAQPVGHAVADARDPSVAEALRPIQQT